MQLSSLIQSIDIIKTIGSTDVEIANVQFDSRKATEGSLFIATRGTATDGHQYISKAIEQGAIAVVCEELPEALNDEVTYILTDSSSDALGQIAHTWFGKPSTKLTLVGVTGTNGKTTTATLLYQLFRKFGHKSGLLSTVCNYIDERPVEATHTTPDPLELNQLLAEMVYEGCEYAFMEVSSHSIDQRRIAGLQFAGGIFSNITRDHIDYHKTFDAYLKAKKRFFDDLPETAFALTNLDDKNGMVMLQNTKAGKKTYSTRTLADFRGKIIEENFDGMVLHMNDIEVAVPFIGRFNVSNLLAVFGTAVLLGCPEHDVLVHLSSLQPVSGRFEALRSPNGFTAIVDYAHTPDALKNVLGTINDIVNGKSQVITVVGCGGNRDKGKRPMMAREAVSASNKVIFTSDNPRDEEPMDILNDMLAGLNDEEKRGTLTIPDREQAIKTACMLAQKGDVVLIAGKGHEDYQIIKGVKHHFDDKEVVRAYFVSMQ
ncbi:UDP-N-acetylmuramoyl-L-alanyl-D-glutamate--2,6-diaminopimelate ligase [Paludibacter jiangxiensis]|uniref:UDP-N-acetylmuramoyl-L-alanyl-D-glutamate--2,6-diaminopimelate ligase n=1 Tax=Paludibacter jiangxiensis TaxID=681398 RepID=A0A170YDZ2_9BACT|nr:UDP-N-acetylmuramoyl-L-alanyl-D-glutamate--2,6-diaminopimelate ligase [Paludibacter jiangxiensis]GAT61730.1 UDP-N-acetylmuramoyl-L-alanyl-D-glutamate--2,6-diaminopimelate ligase [Paludibacter jiangxiensis]